MSVNITYILIVTWFTIVYWTAPFKCNILNYGNLCSFCMEYLTFVNIFDDDHIFVDENNQFLIQIHF